MVNSDLPHSLEDGSWKTKFSKANTFFIDLYFADD